MHQSINFLCDAHDFVALDLSVLGIEIGYEKFSAEAVIADGSKFARMLFNNGFICSLFAIIPGVPADISLSVARGGEGRHSSEHFPNSKHLRKSNWLRFHSQSFPIQINDALKLSLGKTGYQVHMGLTRYRKNSRLTAVY